MAGRHGNPRRWLRGRERPQPLAEVVQCSVRRPAGVVSHVRVCVGDAVLRACDGNTDCAVQRDCLRERGRERLHYSPGKTNYFTEY